MAARTARSSTVSEFEADGDIVTLGHHSFRLTAGTLESYIDTGEISFVALGLTVYGRNNAVLLDDISFSLEERSFLAVVGPSGAGKSTLINASTGFRPADRGRVLYSDWDLYENFEVLQQCIGYVPQGDILHPQLTIRRALEYAAELRFPDDTSAADRSTQVRQAMDTLGILERANLPITGIAASNSIREIVKEAGIYRRERSIGLSISG